MRRFLNKQSDCRQSDEECCQDVIVIHGPRGPQGSQGPRGCEGPAGPRTVPMITGTVLATNGNLPPTTTLESNQWINFTELFDSTGSFDPVTGIYTSPLAGTISVSFTCSPTTTMTGPSTAITNILLNGTPVGTAGTHTANSPGPMTTATAMFSGSISSGSTITVATTYMPGIGTIEANNGNLSIFQFI